MLVVAVLQHIEVFLNIMLCGIINAVNPVLTPNIPSLAHQHCLPSWGPQRTPWFFFVIFQLFDAVDYSNYVFWVSETIIQ